MLGFHKMMMFLGVLYFTFTATFISARDCDELGILLYEDLGCVPEYGNDTDCPLKYSCKGLEKSGTHCYFRGKSYENRERVDSSLTSPSCDAGCFCETSDERSGFTCAILDCPEWLGVPVQRGCYSNYTLERCCSVGEICPPFDNNEKCEVDGKQYKEGQQFYPSNTCLNCVCQKGFEGKYEEPFCRRRTCGQQLRRFGDHIQASCAPFYRKSLQEKVFCCPDDWICPNGTENIKREPQSEETCQFGEKKVRIGQYFERENFEDGYGRHHSTVKCECVIPPLMKCVDSE